MALTRKTLKNMGLDEEKIEQIIEDHSETVSALKAEIAKYKPDAERLPAVQAELDALKSKGDGGLKAQNEALQKELETLKAENAAKETRAAKESAVRAYYEGKNITGKNLDIAMRGTQLDTLELENGKIKDTAELDSLVSGVFSGLVGVPFAQGANTPHPPANTGGAMSKADIFAKFPGAANAKARQDAIAANLNLFEKEN